MAESRGHGERNLNQLKAVTKSQHPLKRGMQNSSGSFPYSQVEELKVTDKVSRSQAGNWRKGVRCAV